MYVKESDAFAPQVLTEAEHARIVDDIVALEFAMVDQRVVRRNLEFLCWLDLALP